MPTSTISYTHTLQVFVVVIVVLVLVLVVVIIVDVADPLLTIINGNFDQQELNLLYVE